MFNDCGSVGDNSCSSDYVANYGGYVNNREPCNVARADRGSSKCLNFGIDKILSTEETEQRKRSNAVEFDTRYFHSTLHCCQMNHLSYAQFYPPLYISTSGILPVVRKYANFVIEDRVSSDIGTSKRKRIWSRAVFSKLQRKGLEKRFQVQKYIMKPDRKQLAATLGLTDAQVKVWFQNRRMKWRNSRENGDKKETDEKSAK